MISKLRFEAIARAFVKQIAHAFVGLFVCQIKV